MAKIDPDELCPCGSGKVYRDCHLPSVNENRSPAITDHLRLVVIPEPDPGMRPVFIFSGKGTVIMRGTETGLSMDCGRCGAPLVTGVRRTQFQGVVFKCNSCGAFNDT